MSDLVEFLQARLDEDEAAARRASPGGWRYGDVDSVAGGTLYDETRRIADLCFEQPRDHDGSIVRHLLSDEADANGVHIARHDPARVLAEVEAKRRIVDLHKATDGMNTYGGRLTACDTCGDSGEYPVRFPCPTLRLLALPHVDHPDYREEWRP